ncbi:MAG: polysaccharide deacetylase family protein [Candidatus Omnitrophota bacterium]
MNHTNGKVIIVGYHQIVPSGSAMRYALKKSDLERQIRWLKENDFRIMSLADLLRVLHDPAAFPRKGAVFTFDDCLDCHFEVVVPALREFGYTGCFFAPVGLIGKKGYLNWEQLGEMARQGMEVGSHGFSHDLLDTMPKERLTRELKDSKEILEKRLRTRCDLFSVPRGYYNRNILRAAEEAGYSAVCTSKFGFVRCGASSMSLPRFVPKKDQTFDEFTGIVSGDTMNGFRIKSLELLYATVRKVIGSSAYERIRRNIFKEDYRY